MPHFSLYSAFETDLGPQTEPLTHRRAGASAALAKPLIQLVSVWSNSVRMNAGEGCGAVASLCDAKVGLGRPRAVVIPHDTPLAKASARAHAVLKSVQMHL